jgi:hypothetical protein
MASSLDDFELLSRLGEGAYSSVYKVKKKAAGALECKLAQHVYTHFLPTLNPNLTANPIPHLSIPLVYFPTSTTLPFPFY